MWQGAVEKNKYTTVLKAFPRTLSPCVLGGPTNN